MKRLRGKLKGLFFLLRGHRFIYTRLIDFIYHLAQLSRWISKQKDIAFNDFYTLKFDYSKRELLYETIIRDQGLDSNINYLEFGVSQGVSFRWWVDRIKDQGAKFYGFDTFDGLPEDWGSFKKGDMNNSGKPPVIDDKRVKFFKGMFQDTLYPNLSEFNLNRLVVHMDADLYSSTSFVLRTLTEYLLTGDIIIFDEFNVPLHEFKAFTEWVKNNDIKYRVIGAVNNFYQIAIIIK